MLDITDRWTIIYCSNNHKHIFKEEEEELKIQNLTIPSLLHFHETSQEPTNVHEPVKQNLLYSTGTI